MRCADNIRCRTRGIVEQLIPCFFKVNPLREVRVKMKLAVFLSDWRRTEDSFERIKADAMGVILVGNGVYHAVVKENGKGSPVLSKAGASFYVLSDDLETRGFTAAQVDPKVKVIGYGDVVELIMNDYEKTAWL
jgi:sulfur relay protein TusB/DsrH